MQNLFDANKEYDISIIGRITLDLNPTDYYNTLDKNRNFNLYVGGSAGNIAIGLNRLKRKVNFISKISNDNLGKVISNYLKREKFSLDQIQIDEKRKIGLTFTEMISEQESNIIMYRENVADLFINSDCIDERKIANSKFSLISAVSLSGDISFEACKKLANIAKENKSCLIFDLDFRPYTWKNDDQIQERYWEIVNSSQILIGSKEEFELLFKEKPTTIELEDLFKKLLNQKKVKIIICKLGSLGSILYTKTKKISIGIVRVKLLKGYGGGDAFCSSFIHYLLKNEELDTCLHYATCAASMVVSSLSSSDALPEERQLINFVHRTKPQYGPVTKDWNN